MGIYRLPLISKCLGAVCAARRVRWRLWLVILFIHFSAQLDACWLMHAYLGATRNRLFSKLILDG